MASGESSSNSQALLKSCPSVLVSKDLLELIKDTEEDKGEKNKESSMFAPFISVEELLNNVKNYIVKNKLYDPKNPLKLLVEGNKLGSLLGKSECSLLDVRDILFEKFVKPVTEKNSSEVFCSISDKKRKVDDDDSDFSAKKSKGSDDPKSIYESDESMHSYENYETELVKDTTSDDNFSVNNLIIAETYDIDVEYEIESTTDKENSCESGDSDFEDFVKTAVISFIAQTTDSDMEYLADRSSNDESEKELCEEDKWRCLSCGVLNDNSVMRNCSACWKTRVAWLPERSEGESERTPRKEFPRRKRKRSSKNKDSSKLKLSDVPSGTIESLSMPSTSSSDSSQTNSLEIDAKSNRTESDKELCLFCCEKPADSALLHRNSACRVCCFRCGQKLHSAKKLCPVCRRSIQRIVYLYHI